MMGNQAYVAVYFGDGPSVFEGHVKPDGSYVLTIADADSQNIFNLHFRNVSGAVLLHRELSKSVGQLGDREGQGAERVER